MLALVYALKMWKHYHMGSKVLAYTDNVALRYRKTAQNLSPRHVRWLSYIGISMFEMDIAHIPGVTNTVTDAFYRLAAHALCCHVIGLIVPRGELEAMWCPPAARGGFASGSR